VNYVFAALPIVGCACVLAAAPSARADDAVPPGMVTYRSEAKLLKQYPDVATRDGDRLEIMLGGGKRQSFKSTCPIEETTDSKDCVQFALVNYDPQNDIAVIAVQRYESHKALAIDRKSGTQIELSDMPHIAPDGGYLAVVKDDQENVEFIVQAIRHAGGAFKIEGDNLDSEPCAFESWQPHDSFMIVCSDEAMQHFRERKVARGKDGKWAATATGRSLTSAAFDALSQLPYGEE
jgi:hypothetical protein